MSAPSPELPEDQIRTEWLHHRYHAPSDDVNQPVDLAAAGLYEDIVREPDHFRGQ